MKDSTQNSIKKFVFIEVNTQLIKGVTILLLLMDWLAGRKKWIIWQTGPSNTLHRLTASANQDILLCYGKRKFISHHKNQSLISVFNQPNIIDTSTAYFFKIHFSIIFQSTLRSYKWSLRVRFVTEITYAIPPSSMHDAWVYFSI